jgi:hypothetical protein
LVVIAVSDDVEAGRSEGESVEESIFKTLSSQKRCDILRIVGDRGELTFTEIKNSARMDDSPTLSYHLNALGELLVQKDGKYKLSELGQDTYNLMCKIYTYSASTSILGSLRTTLPAVIVANAILWAAALLAVSAFEGRPHFVTVSSFAVLWFISNIVLYTITKAVRK